MKFLKAIVAVALVVFFVVPVFAFDYRRGQIPQFDAWQDDFYTRHNPSDQIRYVDISTTITKVLVFGTAEGFIPVFNDQGGVNAVKAVGVYGQEGSGFYIGSHGNQHLFLTNAHVVMPGAIIIQESKNWSYVCPPMTILTRHITIGQNTALGSAPAEIVFVDQDADIAILKVVGNWVALKDLGYRPVFTRSLGGDALFEGMPVCVVVAIRPDIENGSLAKGPYFEVRPGIITATHAVIPGPLGEEPYNSVLLPWFNMNDVTMTTQIYPGDSGSPVFAWIEGQPVIIGLARAAVSYDTNTGSYYASYFTRIDEVVPFALQK